MPELFERECVWPMAIAMDCSLEDELVDLCADEPTLEEASRTRLKRQRESCLARPLQLVDDETMQILDYIHERFYRQEVDA